jgi:hypothetical protein
VDGENVPPVRIVHTSSGNLNAACCSAATISSCKFFRDDLAFVIFGGAIPFAFEFDDGLGDERGWPN